MNATSTRRIQPLVALGALRKLIKNPEDTHQVFMIGEALRGNSLGRVTRRFCGTDLGRRAIAGEHALLPVLADRAALAALPAGSLGRAYLDFVVSESLSAQGLAEAARKRDQLSSATPEEHALRRQVRDSHDLWHVLTGYGRDPLGEVCLLAFTYAQTRMNGLGVIALLGTFRIGRALRGQPVRAAVHEGYRAGAKAAWLPAEDWPALLAQDLASVRARLGVGEPEVYRRIGRAVGRATYGGPAARPAGGSPG